MAKKKTLFRSTMIIISICVIGALLIYHSMNSGKMNSNEIGQLTDLWIKNVTEKNDPETIAKMFCNDGNLVGTVSQVKRQGDDIKKYFDYFAKLPEIYVVDKKYNISEVEQNVFVNTAIITWKWKGLENPIVARMTFIFPMYFSTSF